MVIIPKRFHTKVDEMFRFNSILKIYTNETFYGWGRALHIKSASPERVMKVFIIIGEMVRTIHVPRPDPFRSAIDFWQLSPYQGETIELHHESFGVYREEFIVHALNAGCTVRKIRQNGCTIAVKAPDIAAFAEIGFNIGINSTHPCQFERPTTAEIIASVRSLPNYKYWE
jgi:hypothetical protein